MQAVGFGAPELGEASLTSPPQSPKLVPVMSTIWTILALVGGWIALLAAVRWVIVPWLARGPAHDPFTGAAWRVLRVFVRLVHRVKYEGLEDLRANIDIGPLIIVSNHTGAIDPLLIQCGCRFHIRWMMARDMMSPTLNWLWKWQDLIPVDRAGRDTTAAREAIRHLKVGGAVGIFPEGRIVKPPREIRPFFAGVGLIVARTQAPVLLVWVSGTPDTASMRQSIFTPSRARVRFIEMMDFTGERDAEAITRTIRQRLHEVTGWPLNDKPLPPVER